MNYKQMNTHIKIFTENLPLIPSHAKWTNPENIVSIIDKIKDNHDFVLTDWQNTIIPVEESVGTSITVNINNSPIELKPIELIFEYQRHLNQREEACFTWKFTLKTTLKDNSEREILIKHKN